MDPHLARTGTLKSSMDDQNYMSSPHQNKGFDAPMKTGVSDFMDARKIKNHEFADKPNYINPFATKSEGTGSSDQDTIPSPTKKDTIERRHKDNYGTSSVVKDDFKTHLTPCRWNETGWKYGRQESNYFDHENKANNTIGVSKTTLDNIRKYNGYFKTQYMKTHKNCSKKTFDNGK